MVLLPEPDTPITMSAQGILSVLSSTKILRKRRPVREPDSLADGARLVRGQVLAIEQARQDRALLEARHLEQHFPAGAERREGQRDPRHERFDMRLGHADHPALGLVD